MNASEVMNRREFFKKCRSHLTERLHTSSRKYLAPLEEQLKTYWVEGNPKTLTLNVGQCLAWDGTSCQHCYLACPLRDQAISIDDQKPRIETSLCNGCGACVVACDLINHPGALKLE